MNALRHGGSAALAALLISAMIPAGMAAEPAGQKTSDESRAQQTEPKASGDLDDLALPVYKPPLRGAPGGRVGGGTRGTPGGDIFVFEVLAPDHTGLTTTQQPALFWYISTDPKLPVILTIMDAEGVEPLLEQDLRPIAKPGVQRVRLADLSVRLKPGVAYQWSITVVPEHATSPAQHILRSGMIQVVAPPAGLARSGSTPPDPDVVRLYAEHGLWYDALDAAAQLMEQAPGERSSRAFAALLAQVGLGDLASGGARTGTKGAAGAR